METLSELLLSSLAYAYYLALEMESLAGHLVVEIHLDAILGNLYHNARDHSAHAVHHRDCVAWHEEVFTDFAVHLERCLWKVNYS